MTARQVPPAYDEVGRHGLSPQTTHDERARFNFLANLNGFLSSSVLPGVETAFEARVKPQFCKEHGHEPLTRKEMRSAMERDPYYQSWSSIRRNTMEMRQQAGRSVVLRQLNDINARAAALNDGPTLQLDPSVEVPHYVAAVDIHCMPGCYYTELGEGDVSVGANYDAGLFVTTGGQLGRYNDGGGQALARWLKQQEEQTGYRPKRILDIGCTVGHNIVPVAQAFPDAEITAVDIGAPVLRYAHARAKSLGVHNITFRQANAEKLDYEDGSFDLIITCMFLHETSSKALPRILAETHRLLAPGGKVVHIEQPQYDEDMPLFEQFMRDWDTYNNNEPFWGAMHDMDLVAVMRDAGFDDKRVSTTGLHAVVDETIFPSAASDSGEDFGRKAAWHVYVAEKAAEA